jgi:hypothetical protein
LVASGDDGFGGGGGAGGEAARVTVGLGAWIVAVVAGVAGTAFGRVTPPPTAYGCGCCCGAVEGRGAAARDGKNEKSPVGSWRLRWKSRVSDGDVVDGRRGGERVQEWSSLLGGEGGGDSGRKENDELLGGRESLRSGEDVTRSSGAARLLLARGFSDWMRREAALMKLRASTGRSDWLERSRISSEVLQAAVGSVAADEEAEGEQEEAAAEEWSGTNDDDDGEGKPKGKARGATRLRSVSTDGSSGSGAAAAAADDDEGRTPPMAR